MSAFHDMIVKRALIHGWKIVQRDQIPQADWSSEQHDECLAILLFNLESVWGLGHCMLGLGDESGQLKTFSFYRNSKKIVAPALVATLAVPLTFNELLKQNGWITHGIPGKTWNEHMTCCIALQCSREHYEKALAHIEGVRKDPGTYRLITRNCVHIVLQSLAAGDMHLDTRAHRDIRTIIPLRAFDAAVSQRGAQKYRAWKYWLKACEPPDNGYGARQILIKDDTWIKQRQNDGTGL